LIYITKKKGLPRSLHTPGTCNTMKEEEEKYELEHENEVTSEDFQDF